MLLLHGWTLDRRSFRPQFEALARHLHVIVFDRRGFGHSRAAPDLSLELDDIDKIAATLSLKSFHLLGVSQGARIAARYAVTRPKRLRSLLLQGAVVDGLVTPTEDFEHIPLEKYAQLASTGRMDEMRDRWLKHPALAMPCGQLEARRLLEEMVNRYQGADLVGSSPQKARFDLDVFTELAGFPSPALLLTGAGEMPSRREIARRLLRTIPNCREAIIEMGNHLCNMSNPRQYNQEVLDFCLEVDANRSGVSE